MIRIQELLRIRDRPNILRMNAPHETKAQIAYHYLVTGRVQGVGFRYASARKAEQLSLHGWVKNLPSGEVEAVAQGDPISVEEFERWLCRGPKYSKVRSVESTPCAMGNFSQFSILNT